MFYYQALREDEINQDLFAAFHRQQQVTHCWRKEAGRWVIRAIAFVDDWTKADYQELFTQLRQIILTGGLVLGGFYQGRLKGFAAVEPALFGDQRQYLDLAHLYVSQDMRGKGLGKALFARVKEHARGRGAQKLYISAHSAVETQAFYRAMGCVHAQWLSLYHVQKEPCDCQLECKL